MLLIKPDSYRRRKLGSFSRYVPLSVPVGIGYLASYLTSHGKTVWISDEEAAGPSEKMVSEYTREAKRPYIFGLSCLTAGVARANEIAGVVKERYPDSKVIFGNMHPTVLAAEVLKDSNVDIVVRGEGEETLDALYEKIKTGSDYGSLKGISFRRDGAVIHNEDAPLPDLAGIPRFPYHLFKQHSERYDLGSIASSRGCPYNCIFCSQRSISGRRYRFFPSEIVIQDIEKLVTEYRCPSIVFVDDSFIVNRERILRLCAMIREGGFHKNTIFDCQVRGDTVDEEVLGALKESGFRTLHFGIETASERLMKLVDKRETVRQVTDGIRMAQKFGFQISGTFILGLPTETRDERKMAYRLAGELSLDYVRFNNATPYPGTKLYEIAVEEKRLNAGDNWENLNACGTLVSSVFKNNRLAYVPASVSEKELKHDILKYNLLYSFRPQSVFRVLKDRIGPAGWLTLPRRWYLKPKEWAYLISFGFSILCSFAKIFIYEGELFVNRVMGRGNR